MDKGAPKVRYPARITILAASKAPVAVIVARKPSKLFRVMLWHLDTGEIEHGSRFTGRLYPERSSISPDGKYMAYFALGPSKGLFSWAAVCKPPFLEALMLWNIGNTWHGTGIFGKGAILKLDFHEGEYKLIKGNQAFLKKYTLSYAARDDKLLRSHQDAIPNSSGKVGGSDETVRLLPDAREGTTITDSIGGTIWTSEGRVFRKAKGAREGKLIVDCNESSLIPS